MNAQAAKQLLKNGVYRTMGETAALLGPDGEEQRALRVLMYHKVNDIPGNPTTVPVGVFDEQMGMLRELGYTVVDLDAVLDYYAHGTPLPPGAVLITFDDGYLDVLQNALPVLSRHGYPAVLFVPLAYVGAATPLPHDRDLARRGIANPTLDWDEVLELDRSGVRIESHGIAHRPLAEVDIDNALDEIALSKLRLEEHLGRPVRSFAYVKGSEFHFKSVHVSLVRQAGYELGFTAITGANGAASDPLRLRRYNAEPYSLRTFELVLEGACDLLAVKDTVSGTRARRLLNRALGTWSP